MKGYAHEMYKDAKGNVLVKRYIITRMGHGTPVDPGHGEDQCGVASLATAIWRSQRPYNRGELFRLENVIA